MHAIPTANTIFNSPERRDFDVYCISTAFEDFDCNTVESTNQLLNGELVGASRQALGSTTVNIPTMPVARDTVTETSQASPELRSMALESTKHNARQQAAAMGIPRDKLELALGQMGMQVMPEKIATVFYTVRAQGTPTWIVHKADGEVLGFRFGHYSDEQLISWVNQVRENTL